MYNFLDKGENKIKVFLDKDILKPIKKPIDSGSMVPFHLSFNEYLFRFRDSNHLLMGLIAGFVVSPDFISLDACIFFFLFVSLFEDCPSFSPKTIHLHTP